MGIYDAALAFVHDAGFSAHAVAASPYAVRLLKKGPRAGMVYDLGCGTGVTTRALSKAGFAVTGTDVSASMLAIARRRAPRARFIKGPVYGLRLARCSAVLAVGEVLNYTSRPGSHKKALKAFFRRVRAALAPGGVFLFDMAGPGQVPAGRTRRGWASGRGWYTLFETAEAAGVLRRRIISFTGARLRRSEERHVQRLVERRWTAAALRKEGFRVKIRPGYGEFRLAGGRYVVEARL